MTNDSRTKESLERTMHTYRKAWEKSEAELAALRTKLEPMERVAEVANLLNNDMAVGGNGLLYVSPEVVAPFREVLDAYALGALSSSPPTPSSSEEPSNG